jgi:GTPase SAR1 family protein
MNKNACKARKVLAKSTWKINLVVVLGDVNVGKSNIIRRILGQEFEELPATIGVEFGYYEIGDIDAEDPSISLKLQIWDTCMILLN